MTYYGNKIIIARFVRDLLTSSNLDSLSITITPLETYGDYCVRIATDMSSEDIVRTLARIYSVALLSTSPPNTQDG